MKIKMMSLPHRLSSSRVPIVCSGSRGMHAEGARPFDPGAGITVTPIMSSSLCTLQASLSDSLNRVWRVFDCTLEKTVPVQSRRYEARI